MSQKSDKLKQTLQFTESKLDSKISIRHVTFYVLELPLRKCFIKGQMETIIGSRQPGSITVFV